LSANTAYFNTMSGDPVAVQNQALALLDRAVNTQAALLSYRDVFYFVALVFFLTLPLILLLGKAVRPPPPSTKI